MNKDSGVTSKLNALLRLGLVSKNNVRRAIYVFQNTEQAMKQAQNRTLMQELLIDVVDRIINNKSLYAMVRQNLTKDAHTSEASVTEDVSDERTKTLLRSGLVKKKDVVVARRALSSKSNMKQMAAVGAYRELMIDMLDSMAKKITGNPALFNAFKRTMGNSQADESFTSPNMETILEFGLDQDAAELLESYKPSDSKLWTMAKKQARGMFESNTACQNAWAMKWYNEQDGAWTAISEGKTFTKFMRSLEEGDKVLSPKQKKLDVNKNKRLDAEDFKALRLKEAKEVKASTKSFGVWGTPEMDEDGEYYDAEIGLDPRQHRNAYGQSSASYKLAIKRFDDGRRFNDEVERLGIAQTKAEREENAARKSKKSKKPVKEEVDTTKPAAQTPEQAEQARRAAVVARAKKLARAAMAAAAQANTPVKEEIELDEDSPNARGARRERAAFDAEEGERNKRGPVRRFISRVADRVDPNRVKSRQQNAAQWSRNQDEHESMVGRSPDRRQGPTATERARKARLAQPKKPVPKWRSLSASLRSEGTEAKMGRVMDAETKAHEQGNLPKRERLTRIKRKLDDGLVKKWQRRGGSINPGVFLNAAAKKRKAALALKNKGKA